MTKKKPIRFSATRTASNSKFTACTISKETKPTTWRRRVESWSVGLMESLL